jgi:SulP family sulfate permease
MTDLSSGPRAGSVLVSGLDCAAGLVAGLLVCLYTVSFVSILVLPVAPDFLPLALRIGLAGATIAVAVAALGPNLARVVWQSQSAVVLVLVGAAGAIAAALPGAPQGTVFATLAAAIALTTLLSGAAMLALGRAGLGGLAKAVPYPVMGGFLAATGALLVRQSIQLGAGGDIWQAAAAPQGWLPGTLLAALAVLLRFLAPRLPAFALSVLVYLSGLVVARGLNLPLVGHGTLGDLLPPAGPVRLTLPYTVGAVDAPAVAAALPTMLAGVALGLLGMLLNLTGIERTTGRKVDYNAELRAAGLANLASGLIGGFVVYPSLTLTALARTVSPRLGLAGMLTLLAVTAGLTLARPDLLAVLPTGLLVLVLAYLGFDFLAKWLLVEAREMPRSDVLLMLAILAVTLVYGFPVAVVAGILAAALRFTFAYARMPTVRNRLDGRLRLSPTERPDADTARLLARGDATAILQLQGFLFFGSANRLESNLMAALSAPGTKTLVIDFREVRGVDISAVQVFQQVLKRAAAAGIDVWFTGLAPHLRRDLGPALPPEARRRATLDLALSEIEEGLLAGSGGSADPGDSAVARLLAEIAAHHPGLLAPPRQVPAGAVVLEPGTPADRFLLLESGRMSASLGGTGGVRVATFLPGAVVGEIGLLAGLDRTAAVTAETDCTLREVTQDSLDALQREDPARLLTLYALLAALMARRVARTNALVLNLDRRSPE